MMTIKELKKEDLDTISYDDLAYMILLESKRKVKINELFQKVCKIKKLDDSVFETKIADFFELLSTDKKFIMLESGHWDLRERHTQKIKIETEDEDLLTETVEKVEKEIIEIEEEEEDIFYESDENDDKPEDDLKDLVIVSDDDETEDLI